MGLGQGAARNHLKVGESFRRNRFIPPSSLRDPRILTQLGPVREGKTSPWVKLPQIAWVAAVFVKLNMSFAA